MDNNIRELKNQLVILDKLIKESENNLKKLKNIPEECIRTTSRGDYHQYYRIDPVTKKLVYLSRKKIDDIRPVIQKEYELKVNKVLHRQHDRLVKFMKNSDINEVLDVYDTTCKAKRSLITPIVSSDEEYIAGWLQANPPCQNTFPGKAPFETMKGEMVRSKSEKIIADTLFSMDIPYVYEPRFVLNNSPKNNIYNIHAVKYPDFAVLNVRNRKTIYWEHLGRLSDSSYCFDNLNKLMLYDKNGLVLGENLIITMESEKQPLEIRSVKEKIENYLL